MWLCDCSSPSNTVALFRAISLAKQCLMEIALEFTWPHLKPVVFCTDGLPPESSVWMEWQSFDSTMLKFQLAVSNSRILQQNSPTEFSTFLKHFGEHWHDGTVDYYSDQPRIRWRICKPMERTSNHRAGPQNASYQGMEHFQQENGLLAFPFTSKAQWRRRHEHESWFLEIVDTRAIIDVHILRNSLDVGYKLGAGSVVDSWGGQGAWFCSWLQSPYVVSSLSHLPLWRSVLANFCNISATSEETHACSFISLAGCTRCLWQLVLHEVFVGLWFDYELLPSASYEYTTKIAWMQMVMGPYPNQSCRLGVQHFVAMFLWTKAHIWPDILFLDSLYFSHTILQATAGSLFRSTYHLSWRLCLHQKRLPMCLGRFASLLQHVQWSLGLGRWGNRASYGSIRTISDQFVQPTHHNTRMSTFTANPPASSYFQALVSDLSSACFPLPICFPLVSHSSPSCFQQVSSHLSCRRF